MYEGVLHIDTTQYVTGALPYRITITVFTERGIVETKSWNIDIDSLPDYPKEAYMDYFNSSDRPTSNLQNVKSVIAELSHLLLRYAKKPFIGLSNEANCPIAIWTRDRKMFEILDELAIGCRIPLPIGKECYWTSVKKFDIKTSNIPIEKSPEAFCNNLAIYLVRKYDSCMTLM